MRVDRARDWLVVAGGPTGHAWVYDTEDGTTVADLVLGPPGATFANDVAITGDALYFTDTFAPTIYRVPIGADGTFGATATDHGDRARCCDRWCSGSTASTRPTAGG